MVKKTKESIQKQKLELLSEEFEYVKNRSFVKTMEGDWIADTGFNPMNVVREFIMEKGLKLYGGLALHEHLKKFKEPLYDNSEFPDYDVFSPNAWEHAKELCDKLYDMGFYFVEARKSILNDEHHQTYKVSVDTVYILDLTQSGCTNDKIINNDCKTCGLSKDNKCISIFNHIPCYSLNYSPKNTPKIYTQTYNYNNNSAIHPNKLFICDPDWLRISMYRELTEPLSNPSRLVKVSTRLDKFNKYLPHKSVVCSKTDYMNIVSEQYKKILEYVGNFVKNKKLINYGASSYNMFVKNNKQNIGSLAISDYDVYAEKVENGDDPDELIELLTKKFGNYTFKKEEKALYWKEIDVENVSIYAKKKNSNKYNKLITFTWIIECLPYLQYKGIRYATIDRMKYLYYRAISLPKVIQLTEENPLNYNCLLNNLLSVEYEYKKKNPKSKRSKFRRMVLKCKGKEGEPSKIFDNLLKQFKEKIDQTKKTRYILDSPKKNYLTKIYPLPNKDVKMPYKPAERSIKRYDRYEKGVLKRTKKHKGKKRSIKHNNIL